MLVANLFVNISYGLSTGGGTYFAKYILGNDNLVALLGAVGLIPTVVGFIIVGPMTKKLGIGQLNVVFGTLIVGTQVKAIVEYWQTPIYPDLLSSQVEILGILRPNSCKSHDGNNCQYYEFLHLQ